MRVRIPSEQLNCPIVQLAERLALIQDVTGSSPVRVTNAVVAPMLERLIANQKVCGFESHLLHQNTIKMETIILEIKAAEGGDDAKLLVGEMKNIYQKACNKQGFKITKEVSGLG